MNEIKKLCVIGGGTAGSGAALLYQTWLAPLGIEVTQIEDPNQSVIGVGEATVGHINAFLKLCQLNAFYTMLKVSKGTIKTAVRLKDWKTVGHEYFTPVATTACDFNVKDTYAVEDKEFWKSFAPLYFAESGKSPFIKREHWDDVDYSVWPEYAWNVDATLLAKEFKDQAEKRGCKMIYEKIVDVETDNADKVLSITLEESGKQEYDFYVDCSGFNQLLVNAFSLDIKDYTAYNPNNRAWATQIEYEDKAKELPYLSSVECKAMPHGWRWSIGQQHRIGTGFVFSDKFISEEDALQEFVDSYPGRIDPDKCKLIKFKTHRVNKQSGANWVLSGLSSGFVEPLESTSIFLGQVSHVSTLNLLLNNAVPSAVEMVKWDPWNIAHEWMSPGQQGKSAVWNEEKSNRLSAYINKQYDSIVQYVLGHYAWTDREDTEYWQFWKKHEYQTTELAKQSLRNWGSAEIFGSWSWALLAIGYGKYQSISHGIKSYLWQDPQIRELVMSGQQSFEDISASAPEQIHAFYETLALGKVIRRGNLYEKHVAHAIDLVDQEKFYDIYHDAYTTNYIEPSKFFYKEVLP